MQKDKIGRWIEATEKLDEQINIGYAHIKHCTNHQSPQWLLLSHKQFDGIGGLIYLLRDKSYFNQLVIPRLREEDRPCVFKKVAALIRTLYTPIPHTPLINLRKTKDEKDICHLHPIAFKIFSIEETIKIKKAAKKADVSLNTFLLYHLNQSVLDFFASQMDKVSWRIPVNMRGAVHILSETANAWGFIQIIYEKNISMKQLQLLIKEHLEKHEHWGFWLLCNILGSLSPDFILNATKNDIKKGFFLTGVFSNLGDWSHPIQDPDEAWLVSVPVIKYVPVGSVALIWAQKLSLTIQVHSSLTKDPHLVESMMECWKNKLLT